MSDGSNRLNEGDSHANADSLVLSSFAGGPSSLIESQVVIDCFLAEIFKLVDELIDTLLGKFTLGHLSSEALLGETAWLSKGLAETFLGRKLLDGRAIFTLELGRRVILKSLSVAQNTFNLSLLLFF